MPMYRYVRFCSCFSSSSSAEQLGVASFGETFVRIWNWLLYTTVILMLVILFPTTSAATIIVPVSEADLTQHATAIVIGTVKQIESYWTPQVRQIFTHITIEPQDVLKGSLTPGDLVLKQHGGAVGSRQVWIEGSPTFTRGEKVLLFLETNSDGSARTAQLYLGKFSLFTDKQTGKEFAYRGNLHTGVRILSQSPSEKYALTENAEEFFEVSPMKERIRTLLHQSNSVTPFAVEPLASPHIPLNSDIEQKEGFVLIRPIPVRWFEPDTSDAITLLINPSNIIANGEQFIDTSMQTWNSVPGSTLTFRIGATTEAEGFRPDDISAISFSDPLDQLTDPIHCTGVLAAVALTSISSESRALQGQTFFRITEADLVYADGWEDCENFQIPTNIEEVTTHELGHVLGLGHSPNPESIMFAFAHFDGRGASLTQDDKDGIAFLYPDDSLPPCTYTLSSSRRTVNGAATTSSVDVNTNEHCGWTAVAGADWVSITEGESSSGTGTIKLTIAANTGRKSRQAVVLIAGRLFTLTQKARSTRTPRKWVPPFAPG